MPSKDTTPPALADLRVGQRLTIISISSALGHTIKNEVLVKTVLPEPTRRLHYSNGPLDGYRYGTYTVRGKRKEFYLDVDLDALVFEGWDIPIVIDSEIPGYLTNTYGRVVAVERNGEVVETELAFRALDDREQPTTFIEPWTPPAVREAREVVSEPNLLPPVEKRQGPLTPEQLEEIARLIKSSMDSTAKNPQPELTHQARIVVRREVTRLAGIVGQRRLRNHSATFSRALAKFEAGDWSTGEERAGRLAIEHLWRWLHGYTKPLENGRWRNHYSNRRSALSASPPPADDDNSEGVSGRMMIEVPCDPQASQNAASAFSGGEFFSCCSEEFFLEPCPGALG